MFGGQGRVPLVVRLPIGLWSASAAQHSQILEAWFAHIPGLVVVVPATPNDNHGLLAPRSTAAIRCLHGAQGAVGLQGEVDATARPARPGAHRARAATT